MHKKIVIIGAGAAGIGMGILLKKMGLDFIILEKGLIGESFRNWPPGTQFISPSFTGNYFGSPDLNALCPETSPAYTFDTEHPSGEQYAMYLDSLSAFYELPIQEKTEATLLKKEQGKFVIKTDQDAFSSDIIIWAGGEYQFPRTTICDGSELAIHNTKISDWSNLKRTEFPIIGGYESAFDSAIQLAKLGKKSVVFDSENHLVLERSDSSFSLSPFTKDRYRKYKKYIKIQPNTRIKKVEKKADLYHLISENNEHFQFDAQPILATGFEASLVKVKDFFNWKDDSPELTEYDESTKVENFFLVGPQVKHQKVIFCFIYKFRQRFAVVGAYIASKMNIGDSECIQNVIDEYKKKNFYIDDLSCCENECIC